MYEVPVSPQKGIQKGIKPMNGKVNRKLNRRNPYPNGGAAGQYETGSSVQAGLVPQLHFPFLREIKRSDLSVFCERLVYKKYRKKEYVYFPYEPDDRVYFVMHGNVEIGYLDESGRELSIDILNSGEIFGAFLRRDSMNGSFARTVDKAVIAFLNRDDFEDFLGKYPHFATEILSTMSTRIEVLERKLRNLVFSDVKTRICKLLYALFDKAGDKTTGLIKIQLTHQDIANLVASSRETASLHLSELKKSGVIAYERKRIRILSLPDLLRIISCC